MIARPRQAPFLATPWAVVLLALVALLVGGCSPNASSQGTPNLPSPTAQSSPSGSASAVGSEEIPQSPVAGVVTSIQATALDKVDGFTLRTSSGITLTFVIGQLDNGADFPPGHLAEHAASLQPVLVYFDVKDGKLVVYHMEDAG